ncbi:hypothetical protein M9H77_30106 [Catharanthus roseus]|uniref:Uncharacterized protein n=1 Tax=Catharanthus roseus TaxID=4058 RepID=A0ACB9ZYA1_CATRO|nr:hypothetical protein M9H77_30106 [Catharanthus roseus]
MTKFRASSSDSNEHGDELADDVTVAQHLGFGHRCASDEDNYDNDEEDDISTPLNPLSSTIVNQWQSSQWLSDALNDYTLSGDFLDMGSRDQIDDLIELGTVQLLD